MDESDASADILSIHKHLRVIVHIDIDCFYAQVEILKNPKLRELPVGVRQKNIVVTSNYIARTFGIEKCMLVTDALKLCPDLVLVCGEDLHDYRQMSTQITGVLQKFCPVVEKLGLDENFVDITDVVNNRLDSGDCLKVSIVNNRLQASGDYMNLSVEGHSYGAKCTDCPCGCYSKLCKGSHIASEMRKALWDELNITTCAGISYNKFLSKLAGSTHKPNQQTTLLPCDVPQLLANLKSVRCLPGIGHNMSRLLLANNISTISELQNATLKTLQQFLGVETALRYKKLSFGIDDSPVKISGKPLSLGLEDGFRKISLESEVRDKFNILLQRLMKLLTEDGRIPRSVKVTVRKFDSKTKQSHKESRQCSVAHFFPSSSTTTPTTIQIVLGSVMRLFHKIVDISKPFHLTLLGISFSKFVDRAWGKSSISAFLQKDVSIQTITNIKSETVSESSKMDFSPAYEKGIRTPTSHLSSNNSGSESDVEPSPKKMRKMLWVHKRKRLSDDTDEDSPSKLCVSELHLSSPVSSRESRQLNHNISALQLSSPAQLITHQSESSNISSVSSFHTSTSDFFSDDRDTTLNGSCMQESDLVQIPKDVDQTVFKELPAELQKELLTEWQTNKKATVTKSSLVPVNSELRKTSLYQYFKPTSQK